MQRRELLGSVCVAALLASKQAKSQIPTCQSLGSESPPGAIISGTPSGYLINASGTPGSAGQGNLITITSSAKLTYNGVIAAGSASVTNIAYINHTAFSSNSAGNWYGPIISATNIGGSAVTSPLPQILLSNSTISVGSASGTTVGGLSVTTGLANGTIGTGAYSWVFSVSGTTAVTVNGSTLVTNGVLPAGSFPFTVSAANAVVLGSPFSQSFTLTVSAGPVESAPGTKITTTSGSLIASSTPGSAGTQLTVSITSGGAFSVNGVTAIADLLTPTSGGTLTDSLGNQWILTSAGAIQTPPGTDVPGGHGTGAFTIVNNLYYGQDASSGTWYTYSLATQTFTVASAPVLSSVTNLIYIDHTAFWGNSFGSWYGPILSATNTGATSLTNPAPVVLLSSSTISHTVASGTVVGAITVTTGLPGGTVGTGAYTWALSLLGAGAGSFQIVGGNLETFGTLTAQTYSITISVANGALVGSPYSQPFSITAT